MNDADGETGCAFRPVMQYINRFLKNPLLPLGMLPGLAWMVDAETGSHYFEQGHVPLAVIGVAVALSLYAARNGRAD